MSKQDGSGRQVTDAPSADTTAHILHMDMDAFFASVELLERPELVGKPVIVGHRSVRSVVTAATYEARKYGVNSAMPMAVALRRCPQAIVLEPHFERYTHYSAQVMRLLGEVTPLVEPLSIDEAFLDVAGALKLLGTPWQIGTRLRERIHSETGLRPRSARPRPSTSRSWPPAAPSPTGCWSCRWPTRSSFLHPQPVSALWGVGGKSEEQLHRLGLRTIGDVAEVPLDALTRAVGRGRRCAPARPRVGTRPARHRPRTLGEEHRARDDVRDRRHRPGRRSTARCWRSPTAWRSGCAAPACRHAPSRSSCASRTSARSRAHAPSPSRPTSPGASTRSRARSTTRPPRVDGPCD